MKRWKEWRGALFYLRSKVLVSDRYLMGLFTDYTRQLLSATSFFQEKIYPLLESEQNAVAGPLGSKYLIDAFKRELTSASIDDQESFINLFSEVFESFKSMVDAAIQSTQPRVAVLIEELILEVPLTKHLLTGSEESWEFLEGIALFYGVPREDDNLTLAHDMHARGDSEFVVWYVIGMAVEQYSTPLEVDTYFRGMLNHLFSIYR